MAPGPLPVPLAVNRPGAVDARSRDKEFEVCPRYLNCTVALEVPMISYGTTAETCRLLAYIIGAATPPKSTCTPPLDVDTFPFESSAAPAGVAGPMFVPKMVTISPGAIDPPRKLAALATAVIAGCS